MPIKQFEFFTPETAAAMHQAFKEAWQSVENAMAPTDMDKAREMLALYIISMAQRGERDVTQLRDGALSYLADPNIRKQA